jgi:hypothetical protein
MTETIGLIREVVLDCPDPWALARFWAGLLGGTPVGEHVSPRPGPDGEPVPWRVCRDPAGHSFCLVVR